MFWRSSGKMSVGSINEQIVENAVDLNVKAFYVLYA
jgi:hypothetical protein